MGLVVYLDPCTINCRKVLSGLDLMGVPYKTENIDYFKGEHKSDSYTKVNPCQTIPAATDGDLVLTESNAILMYGAEHAKDESFYPKDAAKRADINRWLLWEASVWFGNNYVYVIENVAKPWIFKADPDKAALEAEEPKWRKSAGILDERLAKHKFLTGDKITIADIAVAAPIHLWQPSKVPIDDYPNLKRWIQEVEKIPAWNERQKAVDDALMPGHDKK
jgi:glutathione S-transferase